MKWRGVRRSLRLAAVAAVMAGSADSAQAAGDASQPVRRFELDRTLSLLNRFEAPTPRRTRAWHPSHALWPEMALSLAPSADATAFAWSAFAGAETAPPPWLTLPDWTLHGRPLGADLPSLNMWSAEDGSAVECLLPPVRFARYGAETDRFSLLRCDGSVATGAIEQLSIMARPTRVPRPELPLPDVPDAEAGPGEWLPSVRLVDPGLVWLVQQIADAYPRRSIYIVSGYRPGPRERNHGKGRAIDLEVMGEDAWSVFSACRRLRSVGCGYYPNHGFVHVDARPEIAGTATWMDVSLPGEPSIYTDVPPD